MKKVISLIVIVLVATTTFTACSNNYSSSNPNNFVLEGKWKNIGETGFGQAQPGTIVIFNGTNCNFYSPNDTYAYYVQDGQCVLDCTSFLFNENLTFSINIIDKDNIEITNGKSTVKLMRVE